MLPEFLQRLFRGNDVDRFDLVAGPTRAARLSMVSAGAPSSK
jgi:hypothetical protein